MLYEPLTLTLPPLFAAFPPAPAAEAVLVVVFVGVIVTVLVLLEPFVEVKVLPLSFDVALLPLLAAALLPSEVTVLVLLLVLL